MERIGSGDVADDVGEMVDALAEVLADEVAAETAFESFRHSVDGTERAAEGFIVADIADNQRMGRMGLSEGCHLSGEQGTKADDVIGTACAYIYNV